MDDKYWNDNDEFYDDEADDDDDEFNDFGNENIDANNDETFANATDWNEDEHEEMIARDSILSQTTHRSNNSRNTSVGNRNINSNNHHQQSSLSDAHSRVDNEPNKIQSTSDFSDLLQSNLGSHNSGLPAAMASSSTSATDDIVQSALVASILGMAGSSGGSATWQNATSSPYRESAFLAMFENQERGLQQSMNSTVHQKAQLEWPTIDAVDRLRLAQLQGHLSQQFLLQPHLREQEVRHRLQQDGLQQQQGLIDQQLQMQREHEAQQQQARQQAAGTHLIRSVPQENTPKVLTVDELEKQFLRTNISQQTSQNHHQHQSQEVKRQPVGTPPQSQQQQKSAVWSPFVGKDLFDVDKSDIIVQSDLGPQIQLPPMSIEQETILLRHQIMQRQRQIQQLAILEQQQQQQQQQQQLLQQQQLQQQQNRLQQLLESRLATATAPQKPRCLTVEELERQMLADRTIKSEERKTNINNTTTEYPSYKHSLINHIQQKSAAPTSIGSEQRDLSQSTSTGRSMNQNSFNENQQQRHKRNGERLENSNNSARHREYQDRDHHRQERGNGRGTNDNYGNRRDNRRDHYRHHKRETTIIPPQVQLRVIDKTKAVHPLKMTQPDEFLVDRMPNPEGLIQTKKHSMNANVKSKHDGVLTEQERNWLTKVQKKIQAECDENLDQDYYYLLYFNRSSMTDEAANKPCGPSVLDKRFIPRERLLYNNSAI